MTAKHKQEIEKLVRETENNSYYIDIEKIYQYRDEIYNEEYQIDFQHILKLLLINRFSDIQLRMQRELIKLSLNKDININAPHMHIDLHNLYHHHDILLHLIDKDQIKNALGTFTSSEESTKQLSELYETISINFSHIIDLSELRNIDLSILNTLSDRNIIDNQTLLKMTLNMFAYSDDYIDNILPHQIQIIEVCLSRGAKLEESLKITYLHSKLIQYLVSKKGIHQQALEANLIFSEEEDISNIEYALKNNLKLSHFSLIYCLLEKDISLDLFKSLIDNIELNINSPLNVNNIESLISINGSGFSEFINAEAFIEYKKKYLDNNNTLLHLLVILNKIEFIEFILNNYDINPNIKNDLEQTPLFLAKEAKISELLITNGANTEATDLNGHTWLINLPLAIIDYAFISNFLRQFK